MRGLHSLRIEMIVWDHAHVQDTAVVDTESLSFILEPLNKISVPFFEVEMNWPIPNVMLTKLGQLAFTLVVRQRPFDYQLTIL